MNKKRELTGLTDAEVLRSRAKHGANVLTPPAKEPVWKQFLEKVQKTARTKLKSEKKY